MPNLNLIHSSKRERYNYDLSHDFTFAARIGRLIPVNVISCIPGDTISNNYQLFARMAPLVNPILQKVKATFHSFFVPYRLMYPTTYKDVLSPSSNDLANASLSQFCTITFKYMDFFYRPTETSVMEVRPQYKNLVDILDYLGCPVEVWRLEYDQNDQIGQAEITISSAPLLAYYRIYVDYFIDSLKQYEFYDELKSLTKVIEENNNIHVSELGSMFDMPMLPCYNRDYFNTSQYEAQLGTPQFINIVSNTYNTLDAQGQVIQSGKIGFSNGTAVNADSRTPISGYRTSFFNTEFTINDLKELFARQKWADIGNQFGSRYIEQVLGHFGVQSSDSRLGRPDYVGSKLIPFEISEIPNMTADQTTPLGALAGRGVAYGNDEVKDFFCEEHGIYMTLLSVMPEQSYFQGIPKIFRKDTTFDFAYPEFAEIGEQEVLKEEVLGTLKYRENKEVFGYQERYAEYKRSYNRLGGSFARAMLPWTMAIELNTNIDENFDINTILSPRDSDIERVFADQTPYAPHFYATIKFNIKRSSVLPYINRTIPMQL